MVDRLILWHMLLSILDSIGALQAALPAWGQSDTAGPVHHDPCAHWHLLADGPVQRPRVGEVFWAVFPQYFHRAVRSTGLEIRDVAGRPTAIFFLLPLCESRCEADLIEEKPMDWARSSFIPFADGFLSLVPNCFV